MKTIIEMLACARRECIMRKNVYPRWIQEGRMSQEKASHEIACMESIVQYLEAAQQVKEAGDEMIALEEKRKNQPKPEQSQMKI